MRAPNPRSRRRSESKDYATAPQIEFRVIEPQALAAAAAAFVEECARDAIEDHGHFSLAVSGGRTPWAMFEAMRTADLPWPAIDVFQVDERIVPRGDPDRNLTHLEAALPDGPILHPMPVEDDDLDGAAERYAAALPERFDLIHLGLGADGHTASLVPGDPILHVTDRLVAITRPYMGERRMTMTYPALERAVNVMWLVEGTDKGPGLKRLLARDQSIPAARVVAPSQVVFADRGAATGRKD
jgi:6-phosphogluconolactonase